MTPGPLADCLRERIPGWPDRPKNRRGVLTLPSLRFPGELRKRKINRGVPREGGALGVGRLRLGRRGYILRCQPERVRCSTPPPDYTVPISIWICLQRPNSMRFAPSPVNHGSDTFARTDVKLSVEPVGAKILSATSGCALYLASRSRVAQR